MKQDRVRNHRALRVIGALGAAVAIACGTVACSSDGSTNNTATNSGGGTGSLDGNGGTIVVFMPSTANVYMGDWAKAATAQAEELGYSLKVFENKTDQTEQDQQVQQYLATGEVPAAFLWWPANAEAGINSSRLLSKVAPVVQANQPVVDEGAEFVEAYVGADAHAVGVATGEAAMAARDEALAAGATLHSPEGNLLEFTWPAGYVSGIVRHEAFVEATQDAPFTILQTEPTVSGFDAQSAFEVASPVIPKFAADGIDFVTTQNLGMAAGVITALEQNGLTPGEDVIVIAGADSGSKTPLLDGDVYSAVVNSGVIEGSLAVQTVAKLIAAGSASDETVTLEATPVAPELTADPPARVTYMPTPTIQADEVANFQLWGYSYDELGTQ